MTIVMNIPRVFETGDNRRSIVRTNEYPQVGASWRHVRPPLIRYEKGVW
jgi:hypothetical protein